MALKHTHTHHTTPQKHYCRWIYLLDSFSTEMLNLRVIFINKAGLNWDVSYSLLLLYVCTSFLVR